MQRRAQNKLTNGMRVGTLTTTMAVAADGNGIGAALLSRDEVDILARVFLCLGRRLRLRLCSVLIVVGRTVIELVRQVVRKRAPREVHLDREHFRLLEDGVALVVVLGHRRDEPLQLEDDVLYFWVQSRNKTRYTNLCYAL